MIQRLRDTKAFKCDHILMGEELLVVSDVVGADKVLQRVGLGRKVFLDGVGVVMTVH